MQKVFKLIISVFLFTILIFNIKFALAETYTSSLKEQNTQKEIKQEKTNSSDGIIEKVFNKENLKQYGYNIFSNKVTVSENAPEDNYKIKEGDKIDVYFWGDSIDLINISANNFLNSVNNLSVDNKGNIFIQGVGLIAVKGKTAYETEKNIKSILSQKIDKFNVKVSVVNSKSFPLIITGNVKNPGIYYINSDLSTIEILSLAGGVQKEGSLRSIQHISGKQKNFIDLYDILIKGKNIKTVFKKDDVILVNSIGNTAALNSGVKRPAIYEFKQGESLKDLINYAGGTLPSVSKDIITIETFNGQNLKKKIITCNFDQAASIYLHNGDTVEFRTLFDPNKTIEVFGCISNQGYLPYREKMTLKNVLSLVNFKKEPDKIQFVNNSLSNEIDINNVIAEISTKDKDGYSSTKTVYLYELLTKNQEDIELKPEDKILFRELKENEILKTVEILGYVKNPGVLKLRPDMKLLDAIKTAGGLSKEGYLKGLVLLRPSISEEQRKILEKAMLDLNKGILEAENKSQIVFEQNKNFLTTQKELVKIMEKRTNTEYGRISLNIKTNNPDELSEQENIPLQDGDKIYIPIQPTHIMIIGEVLNPSAIAFSSGKNLINYVEDVGGFTKEADKGKIYITKANGFSQKIAKNDKTSLEPGDSIIIPRKISKPVDWLSFAQNFASVLADTFNTIFIITKI